MRALKNDLYAGLNAQGDIRISIGFLPEEEGLLQWITVNGMPFRRFARDTSFIPNSATWLAYIGTYEAINDSFKVRVEDRQLLLLDVKDKHEVTCIPLDETRFVCPFGLIEFVLGEGGTVTEICAAETFHYARVTE